MKDIPSQPLSCPVCGHGDCGLVRLIADRTAAAELAVQIAAAAR